MVVTCGVWSPDFNFKARLPNHSTILTCELYAIQAAVAFIATCPPGKFLIFSDSLSSVHELSIPYSSNHHLVGKIVYRITSLQSHTIRIQWIPSHVGITGNNKADQLAKDSLEEPSITKMPKNPRDVLNQLFKEY